MSLTLKRGSGCGYDLCVNLPCGHAMRILPTWVGDDGRFLGRLSCTEDGAELGCEVVNAVGIRAEESAARAKVTEWEWQETFDCEVWRPLLRWTFDDVVAIHARHGLAPNPLYLRGASRVGCWPCIYAKKEEIRLVADTDPGRIQKIRELEQVVGDAQEARAAKRERERERERERATEQPKEASPGRGRPVFSASGRWARALERARRSTTWWPGRAPLKAGAISPCSSRGLRTRAA